MITVFTRIQLPRRVSGSATFGKNFGMQIQSFCWLPLRRGAIIISVSCFVMAILNVVSAALPTGPDNSLVVSRTVNAILSVVYAACGALLAFALFQGSISLVRLWLAVFAVLTLASLLAHDLARYDWVSLEQDSSAAVVVGIGLFNIVLDVVFLMAVFGLMREMERQKAEDVAAASRPRPRATPGAPSVAPALPLRDIVPRAQPSASASSSVATTTILDVDAENPLDGHGTNGHVVGSPDSVGSSDSIGGPDLNGHVNGLPSGQQKNYNFAERDVDDQNLNDGDADGCNVNNNYNKITDLDTVTDGRLKNGGVDRGVMEYFDMKMSEANSDGLRANGSVKRVPNGVMKGSNDVQSHHGNAWRNGDAYGVSGFVNPAYEGAENGRTKVVNGTLSERLNGRIRDWEEV